MLTVLHILGNEPHESVQRNIYDETDFFIRHGVDMRFAYDPLSRIALETDFIDALRKLGAPIYRFPYLLSAPGAARETQKSQKPQKNGAPARFSPFNAALTLREMCVAFPIDIVHTHTAPAYKLACAARLLGAPIVHIFTVHAVADQNLYDNVQNRILSAWCDELIAVDGYTAGVLLDRLIHATKIKRVNYGIDLKKWSVAAAADDVADQNERDVEGNRAHDIFTLLMIADSDPAGDGTAYDAFADLILRLMHDFDPSRAGYKRIRFIIATNSEYGLRYASELIFTLDLNENVEIYSLSDANRRVDREREDMTGDDEDDDINSGGEDADADNQPDQETGVRFARNTEDAGAQDGEAAGNDMQKTAWSSIRVGNWIEAEAKIKLRSFKYKAGKEIIRHAQYNVNGDKKLFSRECETARQQLYVQADLCLYHSENRFFPYPAAEAIAMGVPVLTNDINFFAANTTPSGKNVAAGRFGGKVGDSASGDAGFGAGVNDSADDDAGFNNETGAAANELTGDATEIAGKAAEVADETVDAGYVNTANIGGKNTGCVDFADPGSLTNRILALIGDRTLRERLAADESTLVRSRYDIDDMLMGIYDSYVRGLRV